MKVELLERKTSSKVHDDQIRDAQIFIKKMMENQIKLSCFSPVSVHLEILLQLF